MIIGVVGPCGAGKSSVVTGFKKYGITIRHIAQEHSYVQDMWKRITNPDILVYLDVSYENTVMRRKLDWTVDEYLEQLRRLQHARDHADLLVDTNSLSLDEVINLILTFVNSFASSSS